MDSDSDVEILDEKIERPFLLNPFLTKINYKNNNLKEAESETTQQQHSQSKGLSQDKSNVLNIGESNSKVSSINGLELSYKKVKRYKADVPSLPLVDKRKTSNAPSVTIITKGTKNEKDLKPNGNFDELKKQNKKSGSLKQNDSTNQSNKPENDLRECISSNNIIDDSEPPACIPVIILEETDKKVLLNLNNQSTQEIVNKNSEFQPALFLSNNPCNHSERKDFSNVNVNNSQPCISRLSKLKNISVVCNNVPGNISNTNNCNGVSDTIKSSSSENPSQKRSIVSKDSEVININNNNKLNKISVKSLKELGVQDYQVNNSGDNLSKKSENITKLPDDYSLNKLNRRKAEFSVTSYNQSNLSTNSKFISVHESHNGSITEITEKIVKSNAFPKNCPGFQIQENYNKKIVANRDLPNCVVTTNPTISHPEKQTENSISGSDRLVFKNKKDDVNLNKMNSVNTKGGFHNENRYAESVLSNSKNQNTGNASLIDVQLNSKEAKNCDKEPKQRVSCKRKIPCVEDCSINNGSYKNKINSVDLSCLLDDDEDDIFLSIPDKKLKAQARKRANRKKLASSLKPSTDLNQKTVTDVCRKESTCSSEYKSKNYREVTVSSVPNGREMLSPSKPGCSDINKPSSSAKHCLATPPRSKDGGSVVLQPCSVNEEIKLSPRVSNSPERFFGSSAQTSKSPRKTSPCTNNKQINLSPHVPEVTVSSVPVGREILSPSKPGCSDINEPSSSGKQCLATPPRSKDGGSVVLKPCSVNEQIKLSQSVSNSPGRFFGSSAQTSKSPRKTSPCTNNKQINLSPHVPEVTVSSVPVAREILSPSKPGCSDINEPSSSGKQCLATPPRSKDGGSVVLKPCSVNEQIKLSPRVSNSPGRFFGSSAQTSKSPRKTSPCSNNKQINLSPRVNNSSEKIFDSPKRTPNSPKSPRRKIFPSKFSPYRKGNSNKQRSYSSQTSMDMFFAKQPPRVNLFKTEDGDDNSELKEDEVVNISEIKSEKCLDIEIQVNNSVLNPSSSRVNLFKTEDGDDNSELKEDEVINISEIKLEKCSDIEIQVNNSVGNPSSSEIKERTNEEKIENHESTLRLLGVNSQDENDILQMASIIQIKKLGLNIETKIVDNLIGDNIKPTKINEKEIKNNENVFSSKNNTQSDKGNSDSSFFYLKSLNNAIKNALYFIDVTSEKYLFNSKELKILHYFTHELPRSAQLLYCRLLSRQYTWIRKAAMKYPSISGNLDDELNILYEQGLIEIDTANEDLNFILNMLNLKDLKHLCKILNIVYKGTKKSEIIDSILALKSQQLIASSSFENSTSIIKKHASNILGRCAKLAEEPRNMFLKCIRILMVSYVDEEKDVLYTRLLERSSTVNCYPEYEFKPVKVFYSLENFEAYEEALLFKSQMTMLESKNLSEMQKLLIVAKERFLKIIGDAEKMELIKSMPVFMRRYTAGSTYAYCISKNLESAFNKSNIKKAVEYYECLLNQNLFLVSKRGKWYTKLITIFFNHLKDYDKVIKYLHQAYQDGSVNFVSQNALHDEVELIRNRKNVSNDVKLKLKDCNFPHVTFNNLTIESVTILARGMPSTKPGLKRMYVTEYDDHKEYCSVEEIALKHFKKNGYTIGFHDEGQYLIQIVLSCFWDIIYCTPDCESENVSVFFNWYQDFPADWCNSLFYERRRTHIEERLQGMIEGGHDYIKNLVTCCCQENENKKSVIKWKFLAVDFLPTAMGFIECLPVGFIVEVGRHLMIDYRGYSSGWPDLALWNPAEKKAIFVEVKGPNDQLSNIQKIRLQNINDFGGSAAICFVQDTATGHTKRTISRGPGSKRKKSLVDDSQDF